MRLRLALLTPGLRAEVRLPLLRPVALDLLFLPRDFFLARAMLVSLLNSDPTPEVLQDKPAEIGVLGEVADMLLHILGVDLDRIAGAVGGGE